MNTPDLAAIAAMPPGNAKAAALVDALRLAGFWANRFGTEVSVSLDRAQHTTPPPQPEPKVYNRIEKIKAWRELHRWGLAETKWLLERTDVDYDIDRAIAVVDGGYTEAQALAELRAAQRARRSF